MKLIIDSEKNVMTEIVDGNQREIPLYSEEAFSKISKYWLEVGWDLKYTYDFTWLGRPVIQLPEDLLKIQEAIYRLRPTVIIETGVAHGGSLIFYASICRLMGVGRVIGIDVEIRPHNRVAIEQHELIDLITLVEGNSVAPDTLVKVKELLRPEDKVLVLLDSNHTKAHVAAELKAYAPLVTPGFFIVVADGIMQNLTKASRGQSHWDKDNPIRAVEDFISECRDFIIEEPARLFHESNIQKKELTYWPMGWLRRI